MKKMVMVLMCVMVLSAAVTINEANALPAFGDWYNVSIQSVGAAPNAPYNFYFIFCTSSDALWTGPRSFLVDSTNVNNKTMLAALLTAYASGNNASLFMPGFTNASPPPQNTFVSAAVAGLL